MQDRTSANSMKNPLATHGQTIHSALAPSVTPRHISALPTILRMRRSTLRELSGMKLYEVEHVCRCFAGELAHGIRHAVVTPLLGQLGHGGEMPDDVLGKLRLAKAFAPRRDWNVAISDGPAERFGEDARIVL